MLSEIERERRAKVSDVGVSWDRCLGGLDRRKGLECLVWRQIAHPSDLGAAVAESQRESESEPLQGQSDPCITHSEQCHDPAEPDLLGATDSIDVGHHVDE